MRQMPTGPLGLRSVLGVTCCAYVLSASIFRRCREGRPVAIGRRGRVFRCAGITRSADLPGPVRRLPRQFVGRRQRSALVGESFFPIERASVDDSRRQDSKDDAFRSCRESFASAIDGPHGVTFFKPAGSPQDSPS